MGRVTSLGEGLEDEMSWNQAVVMITQPCENILENCSVLVYELYGKHKN